MYETSVFYLQLYVLSIGENKKNRNYLNEARCEMIYIFDLSENEE